MTALERLQVLARQRRSVEDGGQATLPTPTPADAPLEAAVLFDVPGIGDVWLVPDAAAAEELNLPAGQWLTPADLTLLEALKVDDRLEVLRWMRRTGGRLLAAPAPARSYGRGEAGWHRWRREQLDRQAAERRSVRRPS